MQTVDLRSHLDRRLPGGLGLLALAEIKGVALSVHFPKSHGKKGNSRRYRLSVTGPCPMRSRVATGVPVRE